MLDPQILLGIHVRCEWFQPLLEDDLNSVCRDHDIGRVYHNTGSGLIVDWVDSNSVSVCGVGKKKTSLVYSLQSVRFVKSCTILKQNK